MLRFFKDIMSFNHSHNPKEDTTTVSILTLQKLRLREIKWPHSYSVTPYETTNIYLFFFKENSNFILLNFIVVSGVRFWIQFHCQGQCDWTFLRDHLENCFLRTVQVLSEITLILFLVHSWAHKMLLLFVFSPFGQSRCLRRQSTAV